jgi:hypothetical protein
VVINRRLDLAIDSPGSLVADIRKNLMTKRILDRYQVSPQKETTIAVSRADAVRLALLLTYITIGWTTIESAAALLPWVMWIWTIVGVLLIVLLIERIITLPKQ